VTESNLYRDPTSRQPSPQLPQESEQSSLQGQFEQRGRKRANSRSLPTFENAIPSSLVHRQSNPTTDQASPPSLSTSTTSTLTRATAQPGRTVIKKAPSTLPSRQHHLFNLNKYVFNTEGHPLKVRHLNIDQVLLDSLQPF
jgi:hypothetical protein